MKKYNLPSGPSIAQAFLSSFRMVKEPIKVISEVMKDYGDTYAVRTDAKRHLIVTQDPEFIEHVLKKNHKNYAKSNIVSEKLGRFIGNGLLTSNGEYWLRQRRLIQPGFHRQKIQSLYTLMQRTIDHFLGNFPTGHAIDIYPLMNKLAFQIVVDTLFNIPIPEKTFRELVEMISDVQEYIVKEIRQPYKYGWFFLTGEINKNFKKSEKARNIIKNIVRERKEGGKKYNDLLDMLLEARYEDTGNAMDEEQIIDEILILIIAGHETTANTLAWALYLLAKQKDLVIALRKSTHEADLEAVVAHKGLAAIIKETMRMYPPAWITDRVALDDDRFKEYYFPKDTIVVMFLYGIHHHSSFWDDPYTFIPERFKDENIDRVVSAKFYPFGAGPRFCIGSGFAMAEMALFLKSFIHKYTVNNTVEEPEIIPLITLRPHKVVLDIRKA